MQCIKNNAISVPHI